LDIQQVTTAELDEWAEFVAHSPTATGLHAPGWRAVLSEAFAVKPLFLRVRDDTGHLAGVLPLFRSRSLLFGDFISSLEDGHCATNIEVARALGRGAIDLLAREACGCLIYKTNFTADGCAAARQRVGTVKTIVPIDKSAASLFAALDPNTRRKVRKAGREGHRVRESNQRLDAFYHIYASNLHRLGTPAFGSSVFEIMRHHLGGNLSFYALERDDRLLGGMVCLKAAQEWTSLYVAVEMDAQRKYGSYLLYWSAIEAAAQSGVARFNLGRSIAGSGTHRFKRNWTDHDVLTTHYLFGRAATRAGKRLEMATNKIGFTRRLWRWVPRPIAQSAGAYLRRALPFV
jgi:CelD/BcsL family acetyltransferase involved in cellulose biosynthesis